MEKGKIELINQFKQFVNTNAGALSEADKECMEICCMIIGSELTDSQKILILFFLHTELCQETKKEVEKLNDIQQKIEYNPLERYKDLRKEIQNTLKEYNKIQKYIGNIMYKTLSPVATTELLQFVLQSRFQNSEPWNLESWANRKFKDELRGFKVTKKTDRQKCQ